MREKEVKKILSEFETSYSLDEKTFSPKPKAEIAETGDEALIFIDNRPVILKKGGKLFPALTFNEVLEKLPKAVVDMGAIPHICNGADIMAPGIRSIEGTFQEGETILVVDEKYRKPLAIGSTLMNSSQMKEMKQGKVIANIHFVGDQIWQIIRQK
jgi:PUA domain protein